MWPVKKSRQHTVWQHYLKSWATDGRVFCLQDGRIFPTGTTVLAAERNFYKVQALTDQDVAIIKQIANLASLHPTVRKHHELFLNQVLSPSLFVKRYRERLKNIDRVDAALEIYNTNIVDDYHTRIEGDFVPLLSSALRGDISWYDRELDCVTFCMFVAAQHLRTRRVKERVVERMRATMALDASRIWHILAVIVGFNVGCSLFRERKLRRLCLIENDTSVPFVTADQPVINLRADGEDAPEAMSIYYPISPKLALYSAEPGEREEVPSRVDPALASALNLRIARSSLSQIYARTSESLQTLQSQLPGGR
jgi:hypothetical protein